MTPIKYYFEFNGNRDLAEDKQGYAYISLISASSQSLLTDHIVSESIKNKQNMKLDFSRKTLEINKKHCPKVFNVIDPLTDELVLEMNIETLYENGQFKNLYEELSNAIGDINTLKAGIKKK